MAIKKNDKSKNHTPYYIWGLHASLAAIENNKRNIRALFCTKIIFEKYIKSYKKKLITLLSYQQTS